MEVRSDLPAPLFVISDLSQLWVQMDIFEKDIGLIHVGTKILLNVPAYPDQNFTRGRQLHQPGGGRNFAYCESTLHFA